MKQLVASGLEQGPPARTTPVLSPPFAQRPARSRGNQQGGSGTLGSPETPDLGRERRGFSPAGLWMARVSLKRSASHACTGNPGPPALGRQPTHIQMVDGGVVPAWVNQALFSAILTSAALLAPGGQPGPGAVSRSPRTRPPGANQPIHSRTPHLPCALSHTGPPSPCSSPRRAGSRQPGTVSAPRPETAHVPVQGPAQPAAPAPSGENPSRDPSPILPPTHPPSS